MYDYCDHCGDPYSDETAETIGYRYGICDECYYRRMDEVESEWYDHDGVGDRATLGRSARARKVS